MGDRGPTNPPGPPPSGRALSGREGGEPLRVLLVEDSSADADLIVRALEQSGLTVDCECVRDAEEFTAALDRGFDVILSDHRLRRFSAGEALALHLERGHDTPFLVVTGSVREAEAIELLKSGARDYFVKDNLVRLGAAVERELADAADRRSLQLAEEARERAQEALAKNEAFLRLVIDQDPNFIFVKDRKGVFVLANRAVADAYGTTVEDLEGKTDADFNPDAEEVEAFRRHDLSVMDSAEERLIPEEVITDAAGRRRLLRTVKRPLRTAEGKIDRVLGVSVDVTDLKRVELELRESEERLGLFFNSPGAMRGLLEVVEDGLVHLACNRTAAEFFGRSREELEGCRVGDMPEPASVLASWMAQYRAAKSAGSPVVFDFEHQMVKGVRHFRVVVSPAHDPGGKERFAYVADDMSAEWEANQAIEANEQRFRRVVEASPNGILLVDSAGRIALANRSSEEIFGYHRDELIGESIDLLVPAELRHQHVGDREAFLHDPENRRMGGGREVHGLRKDGSRFPAEIGLSHFESFAGRQVLATVVDVSDRRALEAQLQQAQKMEAIGRLAGGLAHDFNNVLGVILGLGELAREDLASDDPVQRRLSEIVAAARKATDLTRQMLAFSRQQVMHPQPLNLNAVVEESKRLLAQMIGADIELRLHLEPDLGTVRADPTQIAQVLMNLAVNARDAMPDGGLLTFETSNVDLDEEYVRHHGAGRPGPHVRLTVADTGHGMDEDTLDRVFEPFFSTKGEGKGTGLGLSTVYGIIKQSGGFLWVYSEPGRGTTFRIYLPRVREDARPVEAPREEEIVVPGTETVLLVEDQDAVRRMTQELLRRQGYIVLAASGAEEALHIVESCASPIDLVLTDVVMPGASGGELAVRLRELRPQLRVLFMSGYSNGAIQGRRLLDQDVQLLEKPFTAVQLGKAIRKALEG